MLLCLATVVVAVAAALTSPVRASPDRLTVFAAASLKNALDEASAAWSAETGIAVSIAYAGSSTLARQIQYGAPADLFLSANAAWMDVLERDGMLAAGSRRDLIGNDLVLIAWEEVEPPQRAPSQIAGFLLKRFGDPTTADRLAMAFVDAVPAGIYGKAALRSLGVWEAIAPKIAQTDNVRAALALVARGEAPLGIVYRSDSQASEDVREIAAFPADSHPPIVYPGAVLHHSAHPSAQAFLDYLRTAAGQRIFTAHGFRPLPKGTN